MSTNTAQLKSNLLEAAQEGELKAIQEAISNKENLDVVDHIGNTPLILAAAGGHKECVLELLKANANVNAKNRFNRNALFAAAYNEIFGIISILMDAGCDPDCADTQENTPLMTAAMNGNSLSVLFILVNPKFRKSSINAQNFEGQTALHLAAAADHNETESISKLIKAGANLEVQDQLLRTPLCLAVEKENISSAVILLRAKADLRSLRQLDSIVVSKITRKYGIIKFLIKASQGSAEALNELGGIFEYGKGVKKDLEMAVKFYREAVEQDYSYAQFNLGNCYAFGKGVIKNLKMAFDLYRGAAEQGNSLAQCSVGVCFENGHGVEKETNMAVEYYKRSAEQGCPEGQTYLARFYEQGIIVEKNLKKAIELWQAAALEGNPIAQLNLGTCYEKGLGVEEDLKKAVELYQKAADQENSIAQVNLGVFYEHGNGVVKDLKKAAELYRNAANQGDGRGQTFLGICYEQGIGVEKDVKVAVELYKKAADQNYSQAQHYLGICYQQGLVLDKDIYQAMEYYKKAGENGYHYGFFRLGLIYWDRIDSKENSEKAYAYFLKAALQNNNKAKYMLALCYEEGKGVKMDLKKALELNKQLATKGEDEATNNLRKCLRNILRLEFSSVINYFDIFELKEICHFAIGQGVLEAHYCLAKIYEEGPYSYLQDLFRSLNYYECYLKWPEREQRYLETARQKHNKLLFMTKINDKLQDVYKEYEIVPENEAPGYHYMPERVCQLISEYAVSL